MLIRQPDWITAGQVEAARATCSRSRASRRPARCAWQNGKGERFNRTLATEWASRRRFISNQERPDALAPFIEFYNNQRRHTALGGHPPISRM